MSPSHHLSGQLQQNISQHVIDTGDITTGDSVERPHNSRNVQETLPHAHEAGLGNRGGGEGGGGRFRVPSTGSDTSYQEPSVLTTANSPRQGANTITSQSSRPSPPNRIRASSRDCDPDKHGAHQFDDRGEEGVERDLGQHDVSLAKASSMRRVGRAHSKQGHIHFDDGNGGSGEKDGGGGKSSVHAGVKLHNFASVVKESMKHSPSHSDEYQGDTVAVIAATAASTISTDNDPTAPLQSSHENVSAAASYPSNQIPNSIESRTPDRSLNGDGNDLNRRDTTSSEVLSPASPPNMQASFDFGDSEISSRLRTFSFDGRSGFSVGPMALFVEAGDGLTHQQRDMLTKMWEMLQKGVAVRKYSRGGTPHTRQLFCDPLMTELFWREDKHNTKRRLSFFAKADDDRRVELDKVQEVSRQANRRRSMDPCFYLDLKFFVYSVESPFRFFFVQFTGDQ